jgi:DNA-directed RNA polymerase subunit omega
LHPPQAKNIAMFGIIFMKAQYIEEASKVIPETHVLINMVSRRVRQLNAGSRPLIDASLSLGLADVALLEIAQGKIVLAEPLVDAA